MRVASVGRAFPDHYYDQEALLEGVKRLWAGRFRNPERLERLHRAVAVGGRHLALPMERYPHLSGLDESNAAYVEVATDVGAAALTDALEQIDRSPKDVDHLFFVTVTGLATPSIDARLVNRLGLRPDVKRTPIFGLGCVAGAVGLTRASDYLRAFPDQLAVLLSVELCSLTLQAKDLSVANLIASGLFGDGAAAVAMTGASSAAPGPEVIATRSVLYPHTEHVMGWEIGASGFRIVLSGDVPELVSENLRGDVDAFLADHDLSRREIGCYVCHPGGPRVLEALEQALEVERAALQVTWDSLARVGNLSSASVLMILGDTMRDHRPPAGTLGLLLAMGPGFCAELVLLRW